MNHEKIKFLLSVFAYPYEIAIWGLIKLSLIAFRKIPLK